MIDIVRASLLSPFVLAFALGAIAKVARSELSLPSELKASLSVYLLLALGLRGGVELAETSLSAVGLPAAATVALGVITPVTSFVVLRRLGGMSLSDSAGIAAHYGSVSAVSFLAAGQLATRMGSPPEGFMPALLALLEAPGIHVALGLGALGAAAARAPAGVALQSGGSLAVLAGDDPEAEHAGGNALAALRSVLTSRTMVLLVGGLGIGYVVGAEGYASVKPFFETGFKGALVLFLLEMGLIAGARLRDLRKVGPFLVAFGIVMPILHGALGAVLGHFAGLSVGGATVLATMAASASYIAAPPAVAAALPDANPAYSITAALAITFPFNLVAGIPLYYAIASALG